MSSRQPSPFLSLPAELRQLIYRYAASWPDVHLAASRVQESEGKIAQEFVDSAPREQPLCTVGKSHVQTYTPTILLLNRQITNEALEVLYKKKTLAIGVLPMCFATKTSFSVTEFVCEPALQKVQHVVLDIDFHDPASHESMEELLDIWCVKHSLKSLKLRIVLKDEAYAFDPQTYGWLHASLLSKIRYFSMQVPLTVEHLKGELYDYRIVKGVPRHPYHH